MKRYLAFASALFLMPILFLQAAGPSVETQEAVKQSPTFTETDKGYAITFPLQWQWQRDFMGLDVFASAPANEEQIGSMANISVISAKLEEEISLENFFNANLENLKKALREMKVVEKGQVFLDGVEGRKVIYTHTMSDINLRVVQYFVIKKGRGFIITCTATDAEFPKYAEVFDKTVRSFSLVADSH